MEQPDFGVILQRLSRRRGWDMAALSRVALVAEDELLEVLGGARPSPLQLERIASALSLHLPDCYVMAGMSVPDDLAPLDATASSLLGELVKCALRLSAEDRYRLRRYAQSLPQRDRGQQDPVSARYEQYKPSVGAMMVKMLQNRNLNWSTSARILYHLAGVGPLSASTVGAVGRGAKELSPELLLGFATVLAIPVADMTALAGIEAVEGLQAVDLAATDVAGLIWDVRRLSADQVRQVCAAAK